MDELKQKIDTNQLSVMTEKEYRARMGFVNWSKYKLMYNQLILTRMYLSSGKLKERFVKATGNFFTYKKKTYFIRKDEMIYNPRYKMMELVYYQNYPEPVHINVTSTYKPSIDSAALTHAIKFEYAKNLLSASKLQKNVDLALLFSGLAMLASVITLITVLRATGVF